MSSEQNTQTAQETAAFIRGSRSAFAMAASILASLKPD
jgi:hypothetical protein